MSLTDFSPDEQAVIEEIMKLNISSEEHAVIEELKKRTIDFVTPKMLDDNYLFYRFAKARNFNLAEAEIMLKKNACWRDEFGTDTILTDYAPSEVLVKYTPYSLLCFDKEGHAVPYIDVGRADTKGLGNIATEEQTLKYYVYLVEQIIEALPKRHEKFEPRLFLPIFDFENFAFTTAIQMKTLNWWSHFLKVYIDNYPETLKCAFVINAPYHFRWLFAVVKTILPATVIEKIRICGTDGWKEELLKLIDADVLPAFLGGNKTDPDGKPECNTIVKRGQLIPESCYMTKEKKKLGSDFEKIRILPYLEKKISLDVKEVNSNLEWEYDIKSGDIEFSLYFKGETSEPVELIPKQRTSTYDETEKGLFKCEKVGTYTIVLSNSYSWFYSKEVCFKAAIKTLNQDGSEQ